MFVNSCMFLSRRSLLRCVSRGLRIFWFSAATRRPRLLYVLFVPSPSRLLPRSFFPLATRGRRVQLMCLSRPYYRHPRYCWPSHVPLQHSPARSHPPSRLKAHGIGAHHRYSCTCNVTSVLLIVQLNLITSRSPFFARLSFGAPLRRHVTELPFDSSGD
jgi:hypothetical protein